MLQVLFATSPTAFPSVFNNMLVTSTNWKLNGLCEEDNTRQCNFLFKKKKSSRGQFYDYFLHFFTQFFFALQMLKKNGTLNCFLLKDC